MKRNSRSCKSGEILIHPSALWKRRRNRYKNTATERFALQMVSMEDIFFLAYGVSYPGDELLAWNGLHFIRTDKYVFCQNKLKAWLELKQNPEIRTLDEHLYIIECGSVCETKLLKPFRGRSQKEHWPTKFIGPYSA